MKVIDVIFSLRVVIAVFSRRRAHISIAYLVSSLPFSNYVKHRFSGSPGGMFVPPMVVKIESAGMGCVVIVRSLARNFLFMAEY